MQYINLQDTNLKISKICLGSMTWGKQNNKQEAFAQMNCALSYGVNFCDTAETYPAPPSAEAYGITEDIIGQWCTINKNRAKITIATKFSPHPWARGEENPTTNKKNLITAVESSLKRLNTDYIDLYQLHWPTNRSNYHFANWWDFKPPSDHTQKAKIIENKIEILETFQMLIKAGKIRYIGLSDDSAWGIKQFIELSEKYNLPKIISVQNEYNLLRRRDRTDVAETCALEKVAYFAWSPLAMGVLSGKYLNGNMSKDFRFSKEVMAEQWHRFKVRLELNAHKATEKYIAIARKYNLDPCQMAIAFTLAQDWIKATIIGATTIKQLKNNIESIFIELNDDCLNEIHQVYRNYPVPF